MKAAQNGVDFVYTDALGTILGDGTFPTSGTIAAGQNYVDYYYKAQSDGIIEGIETVVFKVNTSCPCICFDKPVCCCDLLF